MLFTTCKLWFDDMKSSGIMPNAKTYRRIVEVYAHLESLLEDERSVSLRKLLP